MSATTPKMKNNRKSVKKTLEEQLLESHEGIITKHQTDPSKYLCIICNDQKSPFFVGLWHNCKEHLESQSHKRAFARYNEVEGKKAGQQVESECSSNCLELDIQELTPIIKEELELTYAKFLLQYRLPFSIVGPLNAFLQQLNSNYSSEILQEFSINRNTITHATASICETLKNNVFQEMRSVPFSLSLDISSDAHNNSYLAVCMKHMEADHSDRPVTKLISILPITTSSTGKTIFDMLANKVFAKEEVKQNCMGIVTDDGSNMTGVEKGVSARLKEICPHIVEMKDISHSLNNVFKKGLDVIPKDILDIIRNICSHFHRSTQRAALLRQIILENGGRPLEIINMVKTRWLSMRDSLERILELWPFLASYFQIHESSLYKNYFTKYNELFLRILLLLVSNVVDCNQYFQKDDLFYNEVLEKLKHTYVITANLIIKKQLKSMDFNKVFEISFENQTNLEIIEGKIDEELKKMLTTPEEIEKLYFSKYDSIKGLLDEVSNEKKKDICIVAIKFIHMFNGDEREFTLL